jgi:hypothetical protein
MNFSNISYQIILLEFLLFIIIQNVILHSFLIIMHFSPSCLQKCRKEKLQENILWKNSYNSFLVKRLKKDYFLNEYENERGNGILNHNFI